MRTTPVRRGVALVAVLAACALAGCAAGTTPDSSPPPASSATPTPAVSTPSDGVSLDALGFTHGPVDRVFVPVGAQVGTRVDLANNVALVLTSPSAGDLVAFYRRTALANGFAVTADDPASSTLTFAGFGWTGTVTGDTQASALLLRPTS